MPLTKDPKLDAHEVDFKTFEDYLDSHINETDMMYFESRQLAREIVELVKFSFSYYDMRGLKNLVSL